MSEESKSNSTDGNIYRIEDKNHIDSEIAAGSKDGSFRMDITKQNIVNGIILSELLGAPKSKRRSEKSGNLKKRSCR